MRGEAVQQSTMLFGMTPDQLIPADHPIGCIKPIVEQALAALSPTFAQMYAASDRPSIPPEHLLKASLLIALYCIRSERQFCERLQYDLLFKWFLDLNITDPAFDASTFAKSREHLLQRDVAAVFFGAVLDEARKQNQLSVVHFTVDDTLLECWASMKSVRPKEQTQASEQRDAEPDEQQDEAPSTARAGRNLEADLLLIHATGTTEREAAVRMLDQRLAPQRPGPVGADRAFDTAISWRIVGTGG